MWLVERRESSNGVCEGKCEGLRYVTFMEGRTRWILRWVWKTHKDLSGTVGRRFIGGKIGGGQGSSGKSGMVKELERAFDEVIRKSKDRMGKILLEFSDLEDRQPSSKRSINHRCIQLLTPSRFEFLGGAHKGRSGECLQEKVSCCDLDS